MVSFTLRQCAWLLVATATLVRAGEPTAEVRTKWDDKCKAKMGQMYSMVFDNNGQPTGTCRAPPFKGCYWGPYKDPKTGQDGCCERGNGVFSTDPVATLEGGCCVEPNKYTYDTATQKGGCCPQGKHLTWDLSHHPLTQLGLCCSPESVTSTDRITGQNHCCYPGLTYSSDLASGQGECCEPGKAFSFDVAARKGDCCAAGQVYKLDPVTGKGSCCGADSEYKCSCSCMAPDMEPKCPEDHSKFIMNGGRKWKIFCELINYGANDISMTDGVASWGQCINECAKNPKCVRAIWKPKTKTCYLRTHGNKQDPVIKDVYSSAHLVEDEDTGKGDISPPGDKPNGTGSKPGTDNKPADAPKPDDKPDTPKPKPDDVVYPPRPKPDDVVDEPKPKPDNTPDTPKPKPDDTPDTPKPKPDDMVDPTKPDEGTDLAPPTKCPEVGGRVVTVDGVTYEIQCTKGIAESFDSYREKTTKGVGECMAACSADPKCQGANLYDDGADEGCLMMKDWEYPASGIVSPGVDMMSFVPIMKR